MSLIKDTQDFTTEFKIICCISPVKEIVEHRKLSEVEVKSRFKGCVRIKCFVKFPDTLKDLTLDSSN